ncbi:hypothetical protein ACPESR_25120 [Nocardia testacea]|uniref:hypothetical protein n=1 Tax=Nocardia testacea TaxID=248551 RepID=UPI003C2D91A2
MIQLPAETSPEVRSLLQELHTELLHSIAVARMAPRGGVVAMMLIGGKLQIPLLGQTFTYNYPLKKYFDICHPDGLVPTDRASHTTIPASDMSLVFDEHSDRYGWAGRMWLPSIFAVWEEDYRLRLARLHQCKPRDLLIPYFGDLKKLRNDVTHRKGEARADGAATCQVLRWFSAGEKIALQHKHFADAIDKFPWAELAMPPNPGPAGKSNIAAAIDDDVARRFRELHSERGLQNSAAIEEAVTLWLQKHEGGES